MFARVRWGQYRWNTCRGILSVMVKDMYHWIHATQSSKTDVFLRLTHKYVHTCTLFACWRSLFFKYLCLGTERLASEREDYTKRSLPFRPKTFHGETSLRWWHSFCGNHYAQTNVSIRSWYHQKNHWWTIWRYIPHWAWFRDQRIQKFAAMCVMDC